MKTKTYQIYFEQVNRTRIEVKANNKEHAVSKARRKWRKENLVPWVVDVEEGSK